MEEAHGIHVGSQAEADGGPTAPDPPSIAPRAVDGASRNSINKARTPVASLRAVLRQQQQLQQHEVPRGSLAPPLNQQQPQKQHDVPALGLATLCQQQQQSGRRTPSLLAVWPACSSKTYHSRDSRSHSNMSGSLVAVLF